MNDLILNTRACDKDVDIPQIREILPPWKTYILKATMIDKGDFPKLSLTFLLKACSEEEIQKWLTELQDSQKTTYSIFSTAKTTGKYVNFKQRLVCQHNTRSKNVYNPSLRSRTSTKNTNCPSKITLALHAIKQRYQGKDKEKYILMREMPCEVTLIATHNHPILSGDSLRFRKVSDEVKEKLLNLFHNGFSPRTALELLKTEIQLNNENYEEILADRRYCPTYDDCYHLYRQHFEKKSKCKKIAGESPSQSEDTTMGSEFANKDTTMKNATATTGPELTDKDTTIENTTGSECTDEDIAIEYITKPEIMNEENDKNSVSSVERAKLSATVLLANVNKIFTQFIDMSPVEVAAGLESMNETLQKIKDPSTFSSCCINFGSGNFQKSQRKFVGSQSKNIKRQKTNLSGKRSLARGRPRNTNS